MKKLKIVPGLAITLEKIFPVFPVIVPVLMEDMDKTAVQVRQIEIDSRILYSAIQK